MVGLRGSGKSIEKVCQKTTLSGEEKEKANIIKKEGWSMRGEIFFLAFASMKEASGQENYVNKGRCQ